MPESSLSVGKSAINQAVLSYAMREYHVGRPKVYMRDLFADPPQALRTDDSRKDWRIADAIQGIPPIRQDWVVVIQSGSPEGARAQSAPAA